MYLAQSSVDATSERERLILEHLPQVRLIARRIHERLPESVSLDDLISTGIIGLISAIDNFDARHNAQIKTYAEHKIRGAILDSLRSLDWAPRDTRKRAKQIEAAIDAGEKRYKREPTEEEIAAELKLPLDEYQKLLGEVQGLDLATLENAAGDGERTDLLQYVSGPDDDLPSHLFERSELEKLLASAIERMPRMERTVLSLYYLEELTLREIAQVMKIHLSRVSQMKAQAILRLRSYMERRWVPGRRGRL